MNEALNVRPFGQKDSALGRIIAPACPQRQAILALEFQVGTNDKRWPTAFADTLKVTPEMTPADLSLCRVEPLITSGAVTADDASIIGCSERLSTFLTAAEGNLKNRQQLSDNQPVLG